MPESRKKKTPEKNTAHTLLQTRDYYTDCGRNGMLFAALVRSPASSGTITNIAIPELPDGYFLFTARDIPGQNVVHTLGTDTPVFCAESVSYFGEPIGIIAGPDEKTVYALTSEIEVSFDSSTLESALESVAKDYTRPVIRLPEKDSLPDTAAIAEIAKAMNFAPPVPAAETAAVEPVPIPLLSENKSTVTAHREVKTGLFSGGSAESEEEIFTSADFDVSGTWTQRIQQPSWSETNGAFCFMENGVMNIYTPTQWPSYLQKTVSTALGISCDRIVIRATNTSGHGANGIWRNATLAVQAAAASYLTGRPVKLVLSREEHQKFMESGVPAQITCRSAVMKDGTIKALKTVIKIDTGAYNPFAQEIVDRLVIASCGVYEIPNVSITAEAATSTNPPTSIFPEMIDSQAFFALENHFQQISDTSGILPIDLRIKNLHANEKESAMPFIFKTGKIKEALSTVIAMSDFSRKYTTFRIDAKHHADAGDSFFALPIRGVGLAGAFDGSGYFSSGIAADSQKIAVTLESDDSITIHSLVPSPSISEIWKSTVLSIIDPKPSSVSIEPDMTLDDAAPLPENIYSNISIMTQLLRQCCLDIQKKRTRETLPLTVRRGIAPALRKMWNKDEFRGMPFHTVSFGAAAAEVELDPYTYREHIKGIWLSIDCGEILSLPAAENTIRLAIQQELTTLVTDETIPCDSVAISFIQSSSAPGQIGNLVHSIVPAAFTAALSQALGSRITEIPCTADTIYSAGGKS